MTGPGLILKPPRAFQVVVVLHFLEDTRTDEELRAYIVDRLAPSLVLAGHIKQYGVLPCAYVPTTGATPQ